MTRDGKATLKYSRDMATNALDCNQAAWHDHTRYTEALHLTNIFLGLVGFDCHTVSC